MADEPLSTEAIRVLGALACERDDARREGRPIKHRTHQHLAEVCSLPHRVIINATGELLKAGFLVLADGRGCWLGTVEEAQRNRHSLRMRAKKIFVRARNLRDGIRNHARRQLPLPFYPHLPTRRSP